MPSAASLRSVGASADAMSVSRNRRSEAVSLKARRACASVRELSPARWGKANARLPLRVPRWLRRIVEHMVALMTEARAGLNRKAKEALGWRQAHASRRQGFAEALAQGTW
jgi:hypothetical protein